MYYTSLLVVVSSGRADWMDWTDWLERQVVEDVGERGRVLQTLTVSLSCLVPSFSSNSETRDFGFSLLEGGDCCLLVWSACTCVMYNNICKCTYSATKHKNRQHFAFKCSIQATSATYHAFCIGHTYRPHLVLPLLCMLTAKSYAHGNGCSVQSMLL